MNDKQKTMLEELDKARIRASQKKGTRATIQEIDRASRMVEAESALNSPSCDFGVKASPNNPPVHYIGLFVDKDCLERATMNLNRQEGRLGKKAIDAPHMTIAYKPDPEEVPRELFGKEFTLVVKGYGYDGENEALEVALEPDPGVDTFDKEAFDQIQKMIDSRGVRPHITLSVSPNGRAVNSGKLDFKPVAPIKIGCAFGAHIKEGPTKSRGYNGPDSPGGSGGEANILADEPSPVKTPWFKEPKPGVVYNERQTNLNRLQEQQAELDALVESKNLSSSSEEDYDLNLD